MVLIVFPIMFVVAYMAFKLLSKFMWPIWYTL